jgi:SAM-dependent methyltransferase
MQEAGKVKVLRLGDFLEQESRKALHAEVDRIMRCVLEQREEEPAFSASALGDMVHAMGLSGCNALDATGGDGCFSVMLAERFEHVICARDEEKSMAYATYLVDALREPKVRVLQGGREDLPASPETIDAVFVRSSLVRDIPAIQKQCGRVLRPGGVLCVFMDGGLYEEPAWRAGCGQGFRTFQCLPSGHENVEALPGSRQGLETLTRFFATKK